MTLKLNDKLAEALLMLNDLRYIDLENDEQYNYTLEEWIEVCVNDKLLLMRDNYIRLSKELDVKIRVNEVIASEEENELFAEKSKSKVEKYRQLQGRAKRNANNILTIIQKKLLPAMDDIYGIMVDGERIKKAEPIE